MEAGAEGNEYEVQKILDRRDREGHVEYLVKWRGWEGVKDRTWEPKQHLGGAHKLIVKFEKNMEQTSLKTSGSSNDEDYEMSENDVNGNENQDSSDGEGEWSPEAAKKENPKKPDPYSSNTSVISVSATGRKRGPYKKRKKKEEGGPSFIPAEGPCRYCATTAPRAQSMMLKHEKECLSSVLSSHCCGLCAITSTSKTELLYHLASVHGLVPPPHPCTEDHCSEAFKVEGRRRRHEQVEHGKEVEGVEPPPWKYHFKEHQEVQEEECNCGIVFEGRRERIMHHRFHHSTLPSFACQYCDQLNIFTSQQMATEHEQYWHKVWCGEEGCAYSCESEEKLEMHGVKQHKKPMPESMKKKKKEKGDVCCEVCGNQYKKKENLRYHMMVHENLKISCDKCGKEFFRDSNLRHHMKHMHGDEAFICDTCSASFKSSRNLRCHIIAHHMDKKYQCEHCPKAFAEPGKLKQHMTNVHIRDTPYKCRYGCGRAYNDHSNMRQHERRQHENDPTYGRRKKQEDIGSS